MYRSLLMGKPHAVWDTIPFPEPRDGEELVSPERGLAAQILTWSFCSRIPLTLQYISGEENSQLGQRQPRCGIVGQKSFGWVPPLFSYCPSCFLTHTQMADGNTRALGTQHEGGKGRELRQGPQHLLECMLGLKAGLTLGRVHPSSHEPVSTGPN